MNGGVLLKETEVVIVTEAAAFQIKDMMKQNEEEGANLRVTVHGGGCSGLSYGMGFDHEIKEGDVELDQHGIHIVVDKDSAPVLKGTVIDYKQSLMGGGFTIENPNAIASCGCGSSFRTATNTGKPENC
nr:iron-sulfur cluster assembly accessory protein [Bacillus sp. FJAT-42315]